MKVALNIDRVLELTRMTTKQQNEFIPILLTEYPFLLELLEIASTKNLKVSKEPRTIKQVPPNELHIVDLTKVFKGISDYLGFTEGEHKYSEVESLLVELATKPFTFRLSPEQLKEVLQYSRTPYDILSRNISKYLETHKVKDVTYKTCKVCTRASLLLIHNEICRSCFNSLHSFTKGRNYEFKIQKNSFNFPSIPSRTKLNDSDITYQLNHWVITNETNYITLSPIGKPKARLDIPLEFIEDCREPVEI